MWKGQKRRRNSAGKFGTEISTSENRTKLDLLKKEKAECKTTPSVTSAKE